MNLLYRGKTVKGGQSARRYAEIIKNEKAAFFKKVGEQINSYFRTYKVEKIIVGGTYPGLDFFLARDDVYKDLRKLFSAPYSVSYTDSYGIRLLLKLAEEEIQQLSYVKQEQLLEKVLINLKERTASVDISKMNLPTIKSIYCTMQYIKDNSAGLDNILQIVPDCKIEVFRDDTPCGSYLNSITGCIYSY